MNIIFTLVCWRRIGYDMVLAYHWQFFCSVTFDIIHLFIFVTFCNVRNLRNLRRQTYLLLVIQSFKIQKITKGSGSSIIYPKIRPTCQLLQPLFDFISYYFWRYSLAIGHIFWKPRNFLFISQIWYGELITNDQSRHFGVAKSWTVSFSNVQTPNYMNSHFIRHYSRYDFWYHVSDTRWISGCFPKYSSLYQNHTNRCVMDRKFLFITQIFINLLNIIANSLCTENR